MRLRNPTLCQYNEYEKKSQIHFTSKTQTNVGKVKESCVFALIRICAELILYPFSLI